MRVKPNLFLSSWTKIILNQCQKLYIHWCGLFKTNHEPCVLSSVWIMDVCYLNWLIQDFVNFGLLCQSEKFKRSMYRRLMLKEISIYDVLPCYRFLKKFRKRNLIIAYISLQIIVSLLAGGDSNQKTKVSWDRHEFGKC